jgi:hypothetical protein
MIVIIQCISWLIKVTDNNDAQWEPEIDVQDMIVMIMMMTTATA